MKSTVGKSMHSIATDMHAIYCAFAQDRDEIYVKVGMSVRPVQRVRSLVTACPFRIDRFVFSHIGGMEQAQKFEAMVARDLADWRTRGEWYRFKPHAAQSFKTVIQDAYRRACGRALKWTEVPPSEWQTNPRFRPGLTGNKS